MPRRPYTPIDCDFHSELELRALRAEPCDIVWLDDEGRKHAIRSPIRDLYTREKEEFLLLPDGTEVRLDMLVSVDGVHLPGRAEECRGDV